MSVYFKFNSELNYSYVDFDGLHISVSDLKKSILHQKRLGKSADFDLLISNAQTKEEYKDDQCLIPKNTSLIVARIPISNQNKKSWEIAQSSAENRAPQNPATENINHDISRMNGTEEDKIQAMMMQSTLDYDPTNYQRVRGTTQTGEVPANYRCHKCNKPGHWIKNCPLNPPGGKEHHHSKTRPVSTRMTGIPRSLRDNLGAENQEPVQREFIEEKREIPEDLICSICKGIFKDAVMIPCCGSSFCDECVRTSLLESEDSECPDCKEKGTSPGSLIPNRFLRNAVSAFHAESSNVLSRDNQKKTTEELETPETEALVVIQEIEQDSKKDTYLKNFDGEEDAVSEKELEESAEQNEGGKESESDDDDDNITVTVPPAYQQSRGATFRDSRMRRIPSHNMNEQSQLPSKNHHDDGESYEEENSESYSKNHHSNVLRPGYERSSSSSQPQGISTLVGEEKNGSQGYHHSSSSHGSNHGSDSQNIYQQQHQQQIQHQHQPMYNQNQNQSQPHNLHSGMMPQMHSHSMYPQGSFHQPSGPYFPPNQISRPMRFEHHQSNYPGHPRHPQMQNQMMRPAIHDNYGVRHHRPPMNHLANAVTQNIQQRYGTGIIDDPLEAFNRIMREKEQRKERFRRSPKHGRSRSFERKRSPAGFSPDNRRQKNYSKVRKRSRSFKSSSKSFSRSRSRSRNRSMRGRSKSRTYSPARYRRKENIPGKERRDHRSPNRRMNNHNNRNSRGNYKGISSSKHDSRDLQDSFQYHESIGNSLDKSDQNFDYAKHQNEFDENPPHILEEQPPPPGDESELQDFHPPKMITESESHEKDVKASSDETKDTSNPNGSRHSAEIESKKGDQNKTDHHHHHHKRSRGKNYDTSSDDKKIREKKKRKKSREHEKKKSKKDRKTRTEKEKAKKPSSKAESIEKTSEGEITGNKEYHEEPQEIVTAFGGFNVDQIANEANVNTPLPHKSSIDPKSSFRRSDSVLDINPNIDLEIDEWPSIDPPEMSKWEREENKSATSVENCEAEVSSNGETKKGSEEKVTSEILKRAENAIFARAISAIRPVEGKGKSKLSELSLDAGSKKDSSPITSANKRTETTKDSKIQAFQVTVPANESGSRSVELKSIDGTRESNKSRKSPMRPSIKNRLGVKVVDKRSRTKSLSRSPKRRLQSDCTKVVRTSRDGAVRSHAERSSGSGRDRHRESSENRRNIKPLSSCIKITQDREPRDPNTNSRRSRVNDRRRSHSPEDKRTAPKRHRSRTRSHSRNNAIRRSNPKSKDDKSLGSKAKEHSSRVEEKSSKPPEQSLIDTEKAKVKSSRQDADPLVKKRSRDSSSSSESSTSSQNSQKHSKRHAKPKSKKKSRSLSAESNGTSKRKKSKKDKKTKKKKKSSRK